MTTPHQTSPQGRRNATRALIVGSAAHAARNSKRVKIDTRAQRGLLRKAPPIGPAPSATTYLARPQLRRHNLTRLVTSVPLHTSQTRAP